MVQNLVFLLLLKFLTVACYRFDPTKIDYCSMKCSNDFVSSGCHCAAKGRREEINIEMQRFRNIILTMHNHFRNKVASGELLRENYPKSSQMMALNYDLELEYLARCFGLSRLEENKDNCKLASFCRGGQDPSQNIFGQTERVIKLEFVEVILKNWYDHYANIPKEERMATIERYQQSGKSSSVFTQMVWGAHTRVGCARIWNRDSYNPEYRFRLICNYAASDDMCPGNIEQTPVYKIGEPCSECGSLRCNNQTEGGSYDALCGPVNPIPQQIPKIRNSKRLKIKRVRNTSKNDTKEDDKSKSGNGKIQFDEFLLAVILYATIL